MRALHTTLVHQTGRVWIPEVAVHTERAETGAMVKNMALFLAAPFVGLVYAILLPFVGLGMLAFYGARAFHQAGYDRRAIRAGKKTVMYAATPVLGLVYIVALPLAGVGVLAWIGAKALLAATPA